MPMPIKVLHKRKGLNWRLLFHSCFRCKTLKKKKNKIKEERERHKVRLHRAACVLYADDDNEKNIKQQQQQ